MKIQNCELKRLLPAFMKEQKDVVALADALDPIIRRIGELLPLMSDFDSIDDLPEETLDLLAKELSIDWYKKGEPPSVKRSVVKNSDRVHMTLGTPEAVRQVAADFYGDAKIEEWFEYDGQPGHFRISVLEHSGSIVTPDELYALVEKVKRAGAIMDGVDFSWENYLTVYCGVAISSVSRGADIIVPPFAWDNYVTVYCGIASTRVRREPSITVPFMEPKIENPVTVYAGAGTYRTIKATIVEIGGTENGI